MADAYVVAWGVMLLYLVREHMYLHTYMYFGALSFLHSFRGCSLTFTFSISPSSTSIACFHRTHLGPTSFLPLPSSVSYLTLKGNFRGKAGRGHVPFRSHLAGPKLSDRLSVLSSRHYHHIHIYNASKIAHTLTHTHSHTSKTMAEPPIDVLLMHGCTREAERADTAALSLDGLRAVLPDQFHPHMRLVVDEIRAAARHLRALVNAAQSTSFFDRVPLVLPYLNCVLACMCRSFADVERYCEDRSVSKDVRWRKMYHEMTDEAGGLPLPQRFMLYNDFVAQLENTLTRSYNFDLNRLEALKEKVLKMRSLRGIRRFWVKV